MDDLHTIVKYHEQVLRSIESQLGQVVENLDVMRKERIEADRQADIRMTKAEKYLERAFRLGVAAVRRERKARLEADQKLAEQREADRREWLERHAWIEMLLERSIRGATGRTRSLKAAVSQYT